MTRGEIEQKAKIAYQQKYEQFKSDLDALVQKYNDLNYEKLYDIIQDYADQMQDVLETMYHCQTTIDV